MQPQPARQDDAPHLHRLVMVLSEHYGRPITREEDQRWLLACTRLFQQSNTSTGVMTLEGQNTGLKKVPASRIQWKTPMVKGQMPKIKS